MPRRLRTPGPEWIWAATSYRAAMRCTSLVPGSHIADKVEFGGDAPTPNKFDRKDTRSACFRPGSAVRKLRSKIPSGTPYWSAYRLLVGTALTRRRRKEMVGKLERTLSVRSILLFDQRTLCRCLHDQW